MPQSWFPSSSCSCTHTIEFSFLFFLNNKHETCTKLHCFAVRFQTVFCILSTAEYVKVMLRINFYVMLSTENVYFLFLSFIPGLTDSSSSPCPPGFWCSGSGPPIFCPAGTKRQLPGAAAPNQCESCAGGTFCPDPRITGMPNVEGIPCRATYQCPVGMLIVSAGRDRGCIIAFVCDELFILINILLSKHIKEVRSSASVTGIFLYYRCSFRAAVQSWFILWTSDC